MKVRILFDYLGKENCGPFACIVSPGDEALANLTRHEGRAFVYPRATTGLLTRAWFPTRNTNMEGFVRKDQHFVAERLVRQGREKLVVDVF